MILPPPIHLSIECFSNGTFQPAPNVWGKMATIIAVCDQDGEHYDLCAWITGKPDTWWTRLGLARVLGEDAIDRARCLGEPLRLLETPADWYEAGGEAACIVDWSQDPYDLLSTVPKIVCASTRLAGQLRRAIARPRLEIVVGGRRDAA